MVKQNIYIECFNCRKIFRSKLSLYKTVKCCSIKCRNEYAQGKRIDKSKKHIILKNIVKINIYKDKYAVIDKDDYKKVNQYSWTILKGNYVEGRKIGDYKKRILMHRLIMNCPRNKFIDHIDHDPLNNKKSNLRIVTRQQNYWNSKKNINKFTSDYKGVSYNKHDKKIRRWMMQIQKGDVRICKIFKTEKEAAIVYNQYAKKLYGEYAWLNKI